MNRINYLYSQEKQIAIHPNIFQLSFVLSVYRVFVGVDGFKCNDEQLEK